LLFNDKVKVSICVKLAPGPIRMIGPSERDHPKLPIVRQRKNTRTRCHCSIAGGSPYTGAPFKDLRHTAALQSVLSLETFRRTACVQSSGKKKCPAGITCFLYYHWI